MSTLLANPAEMIAHGAPRVIHNDKELEEYTEALFQLTALASPTSFERQAIELLTLLIAAYEQDQFPLGASNPISVVRFMMERQSLKQRDLVPQFGSESAVSMFLNGQRKLTLEQVRRLSERFRLSADLFVGGRRKARRDR